MAYPTAQPTAHRQASTNHPIQAPDGQQIRDAQRIWGSCSSLRSIMPPNR